MFTAATPASPTVSATSATPAPPVSPSLRSNGLQRGFSYLRNYTQALHLHSHSHSQNTTPDTDSPRSRPRARTTSTTTPPPASPASATPSTATSTAAHHSARPPPLARRQTTPLAAPVAHPATLDTPHSPPLTPVPSTSPPPSTMTRSRAETTAPQLSVRNHSGPTPTSSSRSEDTDDAAAPKHLPSIRFIPHQDPRAGRPSLQFPTITRTLPDESAIVRVGRYSERDNVPEIAPNSPSAAAIGFKSKVVSRKHCELWCKDGSWYIKDVKSSSGTFLNHIRLSQPNVESKPFRIKDGDIIQLGIDFRGGEEMIFRCVKIRVECNRGWQQALNTFNKQTHQRLRNLAKARKESDSASTHTSECAICLMSIAPCQSLFVAPCSHVWHYKCIRPILNGPTWPNFLCPNCRAVADLEADVEDQPDFEEWEEEEASNADAVKPVTADRHLTPRASMNALSAVSTAPDDARSLSELQSAISNISITDSLASIANQPAPPHLADPRTPHRPLEPISASVTQPVGIAHTTSEYSGLSPLYLTARDTLHADRHDGPMTPRNDAGPFVLDGSAGRAQGSRLRDESPGSTGSGSGSDAPTAAPERLG